MRYSPYGLLFRTVVASRLRPVGEREPEASQRFAQLVGPASAVVGTAGDLLARWAVPART